MMLAHWQVWIRPVGPKEVAPKSHNDFEIRCRRFPALIPCVFAVVDQQIPLSVWAYAIGACTVIANPYQLMVGVTNEVLSTVGQSAHKDKPDAVLLDPRNEGIPIANFQRGLQHIVGLEPIAPNPFMEVIGCDYAVLGPSNRVRLSHEVVEVFDEHAIKFAGCDRIKHGFV
jgi:hypothetical protein